MRSRPFLHAAALMLACNAAWAASRTPWPEVPDPPKSKVEWVARDSVINGLPSRIEQFDSELSVAEVLAYYRAIWAKSPSGPPREREVGPWRTMATLHGPFQIALQVQAKPGQGSVGTLSVANFGEANKDFIPQGWPRWPDARFLQVMESDDGPMHSQYVVVSSRESLDFNVRRARGEWQRRGFRLVRESKSDQPGQAAWVGSFDKEGQTVDVAIGRSEKTRTTTVTTNLLTPVKAPTW
jgi:hypothetical protein